MELTEFTALVKDMRRHQKEWFDKPVQRTRTLLSQCKTLEAEVDLAIMNIEKRAGVQTQMFEGGGK